MGIFSRRRTRRAAPYPEDAGDLVAAAVAVQSSEGIEFRRSLPDWQRMALEFYDLVGEAWYPAQFYARMLSRVRLYPAVRKGNNEVEEIKNPKAQEILARIQDSGGGTSQWKQQYGRLQFLVGDGYLVASLDDDGEEQWEYLSPAELVPQGENAGGFMVYNRKLDAGKVKELTEAADLERLGERTCRAWRLWRKHPTHSEMADSPMRAVIGLLRVLMLLDKAAEAQALSRIAAAGLLVVDDRITIPAADSQASDDSPDDDPFMSLLTKFVVKPIAQPGTAAAVAPLVARVETPENAKVEDLIKLIQLHDPNQTADWQERIEKTVARIAIGLDMPPEEFLGLAQANHWTGWVITEEKWKAHGEPATIMLCEDLTSAYFRQACIDAEVENAENLIVWYDPAHVVTHPDRGKDALAVHEADVLSDDALLRYNNFSERDKATPEEIAERVARRNKQTQRPDDPSEADSSPTGADAPRDAPSNNGPRTDQPSPQPGNQDLRIAATLALEQIRHRVGSKLRAKKMTCEGCFAGTEDVPNSLLAATIGQDVVRTLGITSELGLVDGGADPFEAALIASGVPAGKAKVLATRLARHAADTLYEATPALPDDFSRAA